jgi:integration host factor subunit beta
MIRSEFVTRIAEQNPHLFARDVEALVRVILDRIAETLANGDRVELRDFGTFTTKELLGRRARNPRTGEAVTVAAKQNIHFKPGKAMKARLNRGEVSPEQEAERVLQAS